MDNAKFTDVITLMYNLIEHSDNNSKTSGDLWQYYTHEPALTDAGDIKHFNVSDNNSALV